MGKIGSQQQLQNQETSEEYDPQMYDEKHMITPQQYELYQQEIYQQQILENTYRPKKKSKVFCKNLQEIDYENDMDYQVKKKKKRRKKIIYEQQINARDIVDIIVIILLVMILGISFFRVILQVQVQYKIAQDQKKFLPDGTLNSSYIEQLKKKNNPNQNQKSSSTSTIIYKNKDENKTQEIKFNVSTQCTSHITSQLKQHGYLYDFRVTYPEFKAKTKVEKFRENPNTEITKQQFQNAVDMVGLVHQAQFQGKLNVKESPCQNASIKKQRLQKAMQKQLEDWNSNYNMEFYHNRQLRFCLVVNSYNNAQRGLIYRNIDSILQQNYTNYHIVYTDDKSTDQTGPKVNQYLKLKNFPQEKFIIKINKQQKGMMENIFNGIHENCQDGQIAVMLDGDDSFIGTNVLSLLNAVYQRQKLALLWSNFVTIFNNQQLNIGFSRDYPRNDKKQGSFRKIKVLISSHLKTFYVDLFKKIETADLQTNEGKFYRGASDTAMMIPMIEMANPRIKYLPELLYQYRYDTGQAGNFVNRNPQKQALTKIFSSTPYKRLTDFTFVQKAVSQALLIQKNKQSNQPQTENKRNLEHQQHIQRKNQ